MSSQQQAVRQEAGVVKENPLRMDVDRAQQIISALNTDLADAYVLYHQLKKHHWNVEGAEFRDVHLFLGEAADDVEKAADELAERVQALGGVPISGPRTLADASTIPFEGEDVLDIGPSLENDLSAFGDVIQSYRQHIELARNLGDHATAHLLSEQLVVLEEYAHEIDHYLEDDTLVLESALN